MTILKIAIALTFLLAFAHLIYDEVKSRRKAKALDRGADERLQRSGPMVIFKLTTLEKLEMMDMNEVQRNSLLRRRLRDNGFDLSKEWWAEERHLHTVYYQYTKTPGSLLWLTIPDGSPEDHQESLRAHGFDLNRTINSTKKGASTTYFQHCYRLEK